LRAHLAFIDETGILLAPLVRRTWRPSGKTPILYHRGRYHQKVSVIAALCVPPERDRVRLCFRLYPNGNITARAVRDFVQELKRQLGGPVVIVWDRLLAHRAARVQEYLRRQPDVHVHYLPPYAPELNPMEYVWAHIKMNPLANLVALGLDALVKVTRRIGQSIQRKERLLRGFLRHSPLSFSLR